MRLVRNETESNQVRGYDITTYQGYVKIHIFPYPLCITHASCIPLSPLSIHQVFSLISFNISLLQQRRKMKYGQHLRENIAPEYGPEPYMNYAHLDGIIRILSGKDLSR